MDKELKRLKLNVEKARESVKKAALKVKQAKTEDDRIKRTRILVGMKTRLKTAEVAYREAKPKGKFRSKVEGMTESVNVKKYLGWTGLAVTTVVTAIVAFLVYDNLNQDGGEGSQPDTV